MNLFCCNKLNLKFWILIASMMLSSCKSLDTTNSASAQSLSWPNKEKLQLDQSEFRDGLKDDKYVLRLVEADVSKETHYYYLNPRFFSKNVSKNDVEQDKYETFTSFHHFGVLSRSPRTNYGWYTFQVCQFPGIKSVLHKCWYPLLNRSRYPVPIEQGLVPLDDLTAADGSDVILGDKKALWRSDLNNESSYIEVESVWDVLRNIARLEKHLWSNSDEYESKVSEFKHDPAINEDHYEILDQLLDTQIAYKCRAINDSLEYAYPDDPIVCNATGL